MNLRLLRRRYTSHLMSVLCVLAVLVSLVPLGFILFFVISQGLTSLNWDFFTQTPKPVGELGGGMSNGIVGTLIVCGLGGLMAIPTGMLTGIYIAQHTGSKRANTVRFAADVLNGIPSIVIGVFVYAIAVSPFKQFTALAGGIALGVMMIPLITRTTEEMVLLVPGSLLEGALALGATRARAMFNVVLPTAMPGIVTGAVLALARIAGETAPLIFTAYNNQFWSTRLTQPISSLPVQIYNYAGAPYEDWHRQAWAGALVLITLVLTCSMLARFATRRLERMQRGA